MNNKIATKTLCVSEHAEIHKDKIGEKYFKELCDFAHQEKNSIFLGFKNSRTLKAKNFVGLIQTKSGFCVEILPKIYTSKTNQSSSEPKDESTEKEPNFNKELRENFKTNIKEFSKNILKDNPNPIYKNISYFTQDHAKFFLLECLKTLKNSPFKQSEISSLKSLNLPLLEIFIIMFLNELEKLVKKGLRSDYIPEESNKKFLKGKLLFNENLKHNLAHKERFYTQSDTFSQDLAQNRLIASTLKLLSQQSLSAKTSGKLLQMRFIFADIKESSNFKADFAKCHNNRHFKAYELILAWCELFLMGKSFAQYSGQSLAYALLFDMNKLFESFVAHHLRREIYQNHNEFENFEIKTQARGKFLISNSSEQDSKEKGLFELRPDIVISKEVQGEEEKKEKIFILDTKWKKLDSKDDKLSVSQADLYQMFAYSEKYAESLLNGASRESKKENLKIFLIYPQTELNSKKLETKWQFKSSKIEIKLKLFPLF